MDASPNSTRGRIGKTFLNCMRSGVERQLPPGRRHGISPSADDSLRTGGLPGRRVEKPFVVDVHRLLYVSSRCPRAIELTDGLWPRCDKAMQNGVQPPTELQDAFQSVFKYGNCLGESPRKRMAWAEKLDVPVRDLSKEPTPWKCSGWWATIPPIIRGTAP